MSAMLDERDVEGYLRRSIEAAGGMCVKLPGDVKRGMPDRVCLLPGGKLVFAELKKPSGRISEAQKMQHYKLRKLGFTVRVFWDKSDVDGLLDDLMTEI